MKAILTKNPPISPIKRHIIGQKALAAMLLLFAFTFASCEKGEEGNPGYAYVELTWFGQEPDYVEMDNDFIPTVFYWNWFYRVDPGIYNIYYEGHERILGIRIPYAWELEYEVWENPGKRGKYAWEKGPDGPDAYFTIELSPAGPEVYYEQVSADKSAGSSQGNGSRPKPGDVIVVEKQVKDFTMRLSYKCVEPRAAE